MAVSAGTEPGRGAPAPNGTVSFHRSQASLVWKTLKKDKMAVAGGIIILVVLAVAILAPLLAPYDPTVGDGALRLLPPGTPGHILGLDDQGRDILSRVIWGGRISLMVGILPVVCSGIISLFLGLFAGYYQGIWGEAIMRILDIFFAFPMVLLAIAIAAVLGPGMLNVMLAVNIVLVPYVTRVVYTATTVEARKEYVIAARAAGASNLELMFKEIMPNVLSPLIVYSTTIVGLMIVYAAGLSFLGLGIQPPAADWGRMTSDGRTVLTEGHPHVATIPGLMILLVSLAFNMLGDGLRDALDPHLKSQ